MACCQGCGHAGTRGDTRDEKRAFNEGRAARLAGLAVRFNPYPSQTYLGCAWQRGWAS